MNTGTRWVMAVVLLAMASAGCDSACGEAISLCESCDPPTVDCDLSWGNATEEDCQEAVDTYLIQEELGACTN